MAVLGQEITGVVGAPLSKGVWTVLSGGISDERITLRTREDNLYLAGDDVVAWVYAIDRDGSVQVSDSDFGRVPISDRMRPRYTRAIQAGIRIFEGIDATDSVSQEDLSELKGMFNRIRRRDQWDWFTVSVLFGHPSRDVLDRLISVLIAVRVERKRDGGSAGLKLPSSVSRTDVVALLTRASNELRTTAPGLSSVKRMAPFRSGEVIDTRSPATDDPYIVSQVARVKLERANQRHSESLAALARYLSDHGLSVERSVLVDAFATLPSGPAIFEVKSNTLENERSQVRHAVSQLYEYRYLHEMPKASLWLVLADPPHLAWMVDYLRRDRQIFVVWIQDGALSGPDVDQLLVSGPPERNRLSPNL